MARRIVPATREEPKTVSEIVDGVFRGRIGHAAAMRGLGLKSYNELVETMHADGLPMWAHRPPSQPSRQTMALLARACKPVDRPRSSRNKE